MDTTFSFILEFTDGLGSQQLTVYRRIINCPTSSNYVFSKSKYVDYVSQTNGADNYFDITRLMGVHPKCIKAITLFSATGSMIWSGDGFAYCGTPTEGC